ncbi:polysaccharide biosynthesis protein [bacterium]|nr:polysaccharide biosynthesis protein [bacterium]
MSSLAFQIFGAYSEMWVYWSFRDLKRLIYIHTGIVGVIYIVNSLFHFYALPRSIYVLYWVLAVVFLSSFRMAARLLMIVPSNSENHRRRILIVGAGESGEMLARQILNHPDLHSRVMGFLDDDPVKINRTIHGLKVFGNIESLPAVVPDKEIDEIIIAIPSANSKQMQRIVEFCEKVKVPFKTTPGLHELVRGEVSYRDIRQVRIEDLLGREPYVIDHERLHRLLSGKTIMVTGAAGSIGSELCRQIQRFNPKMIVAIDKDETRLFYLYNEMKHICHFHPIVMQLQNTDKLSHIFKILGPQIIFHAAAYKHVPCMEWYPDEAIVNNFEPTITLANMANEYKIEKFIQISTDKAVNPVNMMGVSKRLCELYIKHFTELGRKGFIVVRFGNVIGSQGSVFRIFEKQIQLRQPITITHPRMERYFMSIVEACSLVLEAASLGKAGCTFLLNMGEPIKILNLAKQMIYLSGLEPEKDVPIIFSDLRPGEKLGEKLWYDSEIREKTENPKIYKVLSNGKLHSNFKKIAFDIIKDAHQLKYKTMIEKINQLIPEYNQSLSE